LLNSFKSHVLYLCVNTPFSILKKEQVFDAWTWMHPVRQKDKGKAMLPLPGS
jgi:hypothetical protein